MSSKLKLPVSVVAYCDDFSHIRDAENNWVAQVRACYADDICEALNAFQTVEVSSITSPEEWKD